MKNILKCISFNLFLIALCGCITPSNKRTNYIVPGVFEGVNQVDLKTSFHMEIATISEEQYLSSNGLNVIQDMVKNGFYEIALYSLSESGEKNKKFDFVNLKDAYKGAGDVPISYKGDNYCWFTPHSLKPINSGEIDYEDCYYSCEFYEESNECIVFVYLEPIKNVSSLNYFSHYNC